MGEGDQKIKTSSYEIKSQGCDVQHSGYSQ